MGRQTFQRYSGQLPLLEITENKQKSNSGKLIVIEGSDGAGKATQLNLLKDYLLRKRTEVHVVDFPRYHTSFYGKMIAQFLRGEYGPLTNIHPHLISVIYAMDRSDAKKQMNSWLHKGHIILSNRYATSNMAHQSSRLPQEDREEFLEWLIELEYGLNKIPKEDIVIYLYVPYQISQELILKKNKQQREYAKGKAKDMVEADLDYLRKSEESYLQLVEKFSHWVKVTCVDNNQHLRSKEEIHKDIVSLLANRGFIKVD